MIRVFTIAGIVWLEMIRKKDVYVLLILLGTMLMGLVSLDVFGLGGAVGYVKDIGLLMAWLFAWVLAAQGSTRELPQEESSGTILPLLAKPVSRIELIGGKWLGCWSVVSLGTLCFYGLVALVVRLKGGAFAPLAFFQGYVLQSAAMGIVVAVGLAFSTRMNRDASVALTYVLTGSAYLILPRVPEFLVGISGPRGVAMMVLYYTAPHFELFDMRRRLVHDYGPAGAGVFFAVLAYGLLFTIVVLLIAWQSYRNKRFSRGSIG